MLATTRINSDLGRKFSMSHSGHPGIAGPPGQSCEDCDVGGSEIAKLNCKPRWDHMKATGARNKTGCWRPRGVILVWGEEQINAEGKQTI